MFPRLAVEGAGYRAVVHAQAARNGVAVLAREPMTVRGRGLRPCRSRKEARLIDVEVAGLRVISVYVPNGKAPSHPDWSYKLEWLRALARYLASETGPDDPLVLAGDFNVAPLDRDAASPNPDGVLCHPEARAALAEVVDRGLADAFRIAFPEGAEDDRNLYTWWDYTRLSFARNAGARIDHVYLAAPLASKLRKVFVDRDERRQRKGQDVPSDHAPVVVDLDLPGG